ncbi:MAG: thioredoxin domain-containing protein [Candidatus ainarchaeum sp.]|nr:thioredoxin domain-containing protein [Candidatus ainarchaeum sp.]
MGEQDTITISKDTMYGVAIAVLACLLVVSVFTQGFGLVKAAAPQCNNTQQQQPPANNTQPVNNTPPAEVVKTMVLPPSMELAPLMGQAGSKVSLLEFSDFQCPFCGMAWGKPYAAQYAAITGTVKKFETDYVDAGKASFRFIPVAFLGDDSAADESVNAANAAFCAQDQGKFFEMHDAIFNAQDTSENNGKYSQANLKALGATVAGIDTVKFNACVDNRTYVAKVAVFTSEWGTMSQANTQSAGTPTFYILVDATKTTKDKVSAAATAAGFAWGMSEGKALYVIIASPEYAKIQQVMNALA